jgi:hypothetical protein
MKDSTFPELLQHLFDLLQAHRSAFRQERTFCRAVGLLLAEIWAFARHTVTQALLALGLTQSDWSAWYRLFSRQRFDEAELNRCLLAQTLTHVPQAEPYVIGLDGVQVPRCSQKMPGTSWLKNPRTPPFKPGIHRAQRFVHGGWLLPIERGYSRALPLRWLPAFPQKAVPAAASPCPEWQAGLHVLDWLRNGLDALQRPSQPVLTLADDAYDVVEFWKGLPERTHAAVRTAKNRALYELPPAYSGRGRRRKYGAHVRPPAEWLQQEEGWQTHELEVRGRCLRLVYRVEGPYLRQRLAERPLFLIVVRGNTWVVGKQESRRKYRKPAFYLVSAVRVGETWQLPLPVTTLLAWLWQRWELEVTHRELKSGFGLGEKQCWNPRSAILSVQWSAWVYAVLVLAGYRTWGLFDGPKAPGRWWPGACRWSFSTLWRGYRAALWGTRDFCPSWTGTSGDWLKKANWLQSLQNAVAGSVRA